MGSDYWLGPHTTNSADPAHWCPAVERAERAEAALAECRRGWAAASMLPHSLMAERDAARADAKALAERVEALEQLCACFRIDKRPSEALHRLLDKSAGALAAHDALVNLTSTDKRP